MAARKRKQPEKKKRAQKKGPGLVLRGLIFAGGVASRNPGIFGGSAAFAVVFSFVAANAMWYQPGGHPSPFMRTRVPLLPENAGAGEGGGLAPRKVTTFVIQREGEGEPDAASQDVQEAKAEPAKPRQAAPSQTIEQILQQEAAGQPEARDPVSTASTGSQLVMSVQKELIRRGLYDGAADGKPGPKTTAAILQFEKATGRPATGEADETLLAALRKPEQTRKTQIAAKPADRPYAKPGDGRGELDPVAAAIRSADANPQYVPQADIPGSSELVMNIQKGLTNLAYTDVSVDGVAGEQTKAAIRHFEKHYRLPQTGEPSDAVLKKMKEIGAL